MDESVTGSVNPFFARSASTSGVLLLWRVSASFLRAGGAAKPRLRTGRPIAFSFGTGTHFVLAEATEGEGTRDMRRQGFHSALTALAAAGLAAMLFFGAITTARATPANRTQAVRAAKQYLEVEAFSLKGLIEQLKYEGYSTSDATYGATHAGANWMAQAVRKAKEYLKTQPFSFKGMVEQLEYEGFTHAQAVHGARAAGL